MSQLPSCADDLPPSSSNPTSSSKLTSGSNPSSEIASQLPAPGPAAVQEFSMLFRERSGQELDEAQALDLATRFLHLFSLTASNSIVPKSDGSSGTHAAQNPEEESQNKANKANKAKPDSKPDYRS